MRDAEDATRRVRRAARDLLDAYEELRDTVADGDSAKAVAADRRALDEARQQVQGDCREHLEENAREGG